MASFTPEVIRNCKRCAAELPPGALDCPRCHALVHEEQLGRVAARARAFEANGGLWDAHEQWQSALQLLPPDSQQAQWIRGHIRELETTIHAPGAPDTRSRWKKWLAPLAPLALLLAKLKTVLLFIFKFKFLLTFAASIALYWSLWGWRFGVGFVLLILLHEMGHYIDIKRRGLPAEMPVFLPGFGAYVKWQAMGVPIETRAAVSLAGPLAGWFGAALCGLLWFQTRNGVWGALAQFTALINVANLIPVFILDGGQAVLALNKLQRGLLMAASVGLAVWLEQWIFYGVAAGSLWRMFTKDEPPQGSGGITIYFLVVMLALAFLRAIMPVPNPR